MPKDWSKLPRTVALVRRSACSAPAAARRTLSRWVSVRVAPSDQGEVSAPVPASWAITAVPREAHSRVTAARSGVVRWIISGLPGVCRGSVGLAVEEHQLGGAGDDQQIQAQRPVAKVLEVVLDAAGHLVDGVGFATQAVDLGPAGDPGAHLVAGHVGLDDLAVLLVVGHRVRARADDAHAGLQHVDELRELVQRGAPDG